MSDEIKVLTLGAGFMGTLHAKAYEQIEGVRNVGVVTRNYDSSENLANILAGDVPRFTDFEEAVTLKNSVQQWPQVSRLTVRHHFGSLKLERSCTRSWLGRA